MTDPAVATAAAPALPTAPGPGSSPSPAPEPEPRPVRHGGNRELLAVPAYRRLLAAWTVSNLGDSALYITAGIWMKVLTGSDTLAASVFLVMGIPTLAAPWIGLLADRVPRRGLMIANNMLTAAVVLALLLVEPTGQLWIVYAVMALYAACGFVNGSAQSGLLKATVPPHLLAPANGLFSSVDQSLRLVAPLAGAAVFGIWGMAPVIVGTAAFFLVGAGLLLRVPAQALVREDRTPNLLAETTAGFVALWRHRGVRVATLVMGLACVGGGMTNSTSFAVLDRGLDLPPEALSVAVALQGVFSIIAGLNASRILNRLGFARSLGFGALAFGLGYGAQISGHLAVCLLGIVPFAFGITIVIVAAATLRQQELPDRLQGRGAAAASMLGNGTQALAAGFAAALLDVVDFRWLIAFGALSAMAGILPLLVGSVRARLNRSP
ncbi:MFS transporter [Zhihengliuella sp.]|uniref:MFS transporter n=1 Tax=Zhihengliuella sp. TaxID=1954483 RepID=UPI0028127476|nr:MFS transporter [Zhihengliuella sp.]